MKFRVLAVLITVLTITLAACNSAPTIPTPIPSIPTYPALAAPRLAYWDMGLSLQYPLTWQAFYGAGQLLIAPDAEATHANPPQEPLVSLQYGTVESIGLDKTATLQQIAARVSNGSQNSKLVSGGKTQIAGLDAYFAVIEEQPVDLIQQAIAFRMPDGRIGWLIGLAPGKVWANFLLRLDDIRGSAQLLRSSEYPLPTFGEKHYFAQGDLTLTIPKGWLDQPVPNSPARLYHASTDAPYQDGSGFVNGGQLVVSAFPRITATTLAEALGKTINAPTTAKIEALTVDGQAAAQYTTTDPTSGQVIIFTAVERPTRNALIIFRWTTPAALSQVTRPTLDALLKQVEFGNKVG